MTLAGLRIFAILCLLLCPLVHGRGLSQGSSQDLSQGFNAAGRADNPITYGLEIEVSLDKFAGVNQLLKYYKPYTYQGPPVWSKLGQAERLQKARELAPINSKFTLIPRSREKMSNEERQFYDALPKRLIKEPTGNLEFSGSQGKEFIFESLGDLQKFLTSFEQRFGEGDVQGHVVFNQIGLAGSAGYAVYENDRALLWRLSHEYQEYLRNPQKIPAINLVSRSLSPMNELHKRQTELIEKGGRDPSNWKQIVASDPSIKPGSAWNSVRVARTLGPSLRTESYPKGKMGFELRMEDNPSESSDPYQGSFQRLLNSIHRLARGLARGDTLSLFSPFAQQSLFENWDFTQHSKTREVFHRVLKDVEEDWSSTPEAERRLKAIRAQIDRDSFPAQVERLNRLGVFLPNFFFPLRKWQENPLIAHLPGASEEVVRLKNLRLDFFEKMVNLLTEVSNPPSVQTLNSLRIAVAQWADQSQLFRYFEKFEREQLDAPPSEPCSPRDRAPISAFSSLIQSQEQTETILKRAESQ